MVRDMYDCEQCDYKDKLTYLGVVDVEDDGTDIHGYQCPNCGNQIEK